ncbi:sporulation sigma factor SigF [compost metagenome]
MEKQYSTVYEQYRSEIYRIGWRIQYRMKKIRYRERPLYENSQFPSPYFTRSSEEKIMVRDLIDQLPPRGKFIIEKLYFQNLTEEEVAQHLNISQQAVSKCKKKMIQLLSRTANY